MKKSIFITAVFAALLSVAACQRMAEQEQTVSGEEGIQLHFTCGDISTKVGKPGVGNENLIKTLDVFLFTIGALHPRLNPISPASFRLPLS